jgi:hypothetical protein
MNRIGPRTVRVMAVVVGILLLATIGVAAVTATSGTTGTRGSGAAAQLSPAGSTGTAAITTLAGTTSLTTRGPGPRLVLRGLLRRTISADVTLQTKSGFRTFRYERGEITAVGTSSVTVQTADGTATTFAVTAQTRIRSQGHAISLSQLQVGDRAMVFASESNGSFTAYLVRCARSVEPTATPTAPGNS